MLVFPSQINEAFYKDCFTVIKSYHFLIFKWVAWNKSNTNQTGLKYIQIIPWLMTQQTVSHATF